MEDHRAQEGSSVAEVLALLDGTPRQLRRADLRNAALRVLCLVLLLVLVLALCLDITLDVVSGTWGVFWVVATALLLAGIALAAILGRVSRPRAELRSAARAVLDTAVYGDGRYAPTATDLPRPFAADEIASTKQRIGPLEHVNAPVAAVTRGTALVALLAGVLVCGAGVAPAALLINSRGTAPYTLVAQGVAAVCCAVGGILLLLVGLRMLLAGLRLRRRMVVTASPAEIEWRGSTGATRRLRWNTATAFVRLACSAEHDGAKRRYHVYGLGFSENWLLWQLSEDAPSEAVKATDQLCRTIVSRTSLPLRDMTEAFDALSTLMLRARTSALAADLAYGAPPQLPKVSERVIRQRLRQAKARVIWAMVPVVGVYLVGMALSVLTPH